MYLLIHHSTFLAVAQAWDNGDKDISAVFWFAVNQDASVKMTNEHEIVKLYSIRWQQMLTFIPLK